MNWGWQVKIPPQEVTRLQKALRDYVSMKGKDPAAVVNKAAGYVALFAAAGGANAKIPKADADKITAFMKLGIRV